MIDLSLDTDKLRDLLIKRAALYGFVYPAPTEEECDAILAKVMGDDEFHRLVRECLTIGGEPADDGEDDDPPPMST